MKALYFVLTFLVAYVAIGVLLSVVAVTAYFSLSFLFWSWLFEDNLWPIALGAMRLIALVSVFLAMRYTLTDGRSDWAYKV